MLQDLNLSNSTYIALSQYNIKVSTNKTAEKYAIA